MEATLQNVLHAWQDLARMPVIVGLRNSGIKIAYKYLKDETMHFTAESDKALLNSEELREIKMEITEPLTFERANYSETKTATGEVTATVGNGQEFDLYVNASSFEYARSNGFERAYNKITVTFKVFRYLKCQTIEAPKEGEEITADQMDLLKEKFLNGQVTLETCNYGDTPTVTRCAASGCAEQEGRDGYCYAHLALLQDALREESSAVPV
jgi:hypothetical protein